MPLLPAESFVYPPDILSDAAAPLEESRVWWVLHTRPRREKALARRLVEHKVGFFLPVYKRSWRSPQNRVLHGHLPLFPGYAFLFGDRADRMKAMETRLVARCLAVDDQAKLCKELVQVYRLISSGAPLAPEERIKPGALVEIVRGPFAGLRGKVVRRGKRLKFIVAVDFLQRGASVHIEGAMLTELDRP